LKKRLKLRINCEKSKAKQLLKKRLDFPFDNKIETMDRLAKCTARHFLKQRLHFPFVKEIETMDRLPKMYGQKIVEATVRFSM